MLEISNYKVYDLKESVIACRNAMRTEIPKYTDEEFEESLKRAKQLARCGGGSGHSNFRKGIRVSFDLKYPNYVSPELQRYGFVDIVCSSSKMHRLTKMKLDECCNKYTNKDVIEIVGKLIKNYNDYLSAHPNDTENNYKNFMEVISSCPQGLELFMRCSTNYEQLATIYKQRKHHKLKEDWGAFCDWIEKLPYAKELIVCE